MRDLSWLLPESAVHAFERSFNANGYASVWRTYLHDIRLLHELSFFCADANFSLSHDCRSQSSTRIFVSLWKCGSIFHLPAKSRAALMLRSSAALQDSTA